MDNSHIFHVSQQCRPLLLPRMLWLPLPWSSHTKKGIRHGPAGKQVQTGMRAHSLPPFLHSQEVAGNTEKREGGSEHWRKGSSFRRALESTCSTCATGPQTQCHLTPLSHRSLGMAWYEGIPGLVWHTTTCREGAANENKALP